MGESLDWHLVPVFIAALVLWGGFSWLWSRTRQPVLPFASLDFLERCRPSLRQSLAQCPRYLLLAALSLFLAAALNPRLHTKKSPEEIEPSNNAPAPVEGIAIYLVLDQSGSMEEKAQISSIGGRVTTTKLALLKQMTKAFIQGDAEAGLGGRPNDMIGLVAFARSAQVLSPLTLDHQVLLDKLDKLGIMRIKDQDGTGIGYAIYKAANLIAATRHFAENLRGKGKPAYDIKDAVMILVTDGMQDPNPLDQDNRYRWMDPEQAAAFAKDQKIRLYVVNIDPQFTKPEWEANRKQMQRVAEVTGGRFYALSTTSNIAEIYKEIDKLAASTLPASAIAVDASKNHYHVVKLFPYLIAAGMIMFAAALVLQATWLRVMP